MASYKHYKRYCKDIEKVENYEKAKADNFKGWHCHHKKEAELTRKELIKLNMYYGVSADELVFLTASEHMSLHKEGKTPWNKGQHLSEETKKKLSEINKGKRHSEETKKKIGEAGKGKLKPKTAEHRKRISETLKGSIPWNKGKTNIYSEETKKKIGEKSKGRCKGRHWYNNGEINRRCYECPDGFVPGRLI